MTSDIREQLSALIDGELDSAQTRFLLKRIDREPALAAQWSRLQLASRCLRREGAGLAPPDFAQRVVARIELESDSRRMPAWLRPAMGFAVAAGVAALALFVSLPSPQSTTTNVAATPTLSQDTGLRPSDLVAPLNVQRASSVDDFVLSRAPLDPVIEDYLLRHGTASADRSSVGYVPYVYVVATPPSPSPPAQP
jgi:sigma-E factor negative regulatory protein RseA